MSCMALFILPRVAGWRKSVLFSAGIGGLIIALFVAFSIFEQLVSALHADHHYHAHSPSNDRSVILRRSGDDISE